MRRNTNGSICLLQESYDNKKEFVKDFIQLCRSVKKSHIESGTVSAGSYTNLLECAANTGRFAFM